jgi:type I restriction enzyme S subunit
LGGLGEYPFFVRSENIQRINRYSHDCEAILVPGEGRIGDIFHYIKLKFLQAKSEFSLSFNQLG